MIVVGALKANECQAQPYIPIWLITTGAIFILRYLVDVGIRLARAFLKSDEPGEEDYMNPVDWLFSGIFAITLCVGTYWVFSIVGDVQHTMPEYSDYCDNVAYGMSFIVVCVFCSAVALFILTYCCCCSYVSCKRRCCPC
ncbi:unnamed protein product [Anisakis simplex]|uniref:G_PROTEIN_RECEP_F2_4 domain-containing protein n=1 Tax=Anisakis simplex TaxID=6269 RepID=A0A0M3KHX2_ANISI|nr:unnamed protein product [Anisakis simplex]